MSCNHDCKSCKSKCEHDKSKLLFETNELNHIKKIVGIVSGKGGVGKSATTSLIACQMAKLGYKVGILDADITGPSIPQAFGIHENIKGANGLMFPNISKNNIKVISVNLLIENETDPVVWRGPVIAGAVKQFYTEVLWEDLDFLFVDMPPGTGDVALTVFQSLPLDGVIIVSTPQDLVKMIVGKACKMADMLNIRKLGLVENMSYMKCKCGEILEPFGKSKLEEVAATYNLEPLARMPIDPKLSELVDKGLIHEYELPDLSKIVDILTK